MRGPLTLACIAPLLGIILAALVACAPASDSSPGQGSSGATTTLRVLAASSLTEAFTELGAIFEREHPGVDVVFNFGGSQTLRAQLEQGLQGDVFASADARQMDLAAAAGLLDGAPASFASNRLVVIVPAGPVAGAVPVRQLSDLARPGVKVVLASPEVPAGAYALASLEKLAASGGEFTPDYAARVLANVVSQESNVRQVAQKVALGEADAGIVYRTDALAPDVARRVSVIRIPDGMHVTVTYPIAALRGSHQPQLARSFVDFVNSASGQRVLAQHGFGPP